MLPQQIIEKQHDVLKKVGLENMGSRKVTSLSGGQKRRLVIAAVLAMDTPILALDEPVATVDPEGAKEIYDLLYRLNKEDGKTIIVAEHDLKYVLDIASHMAVIDKGQLKFSGEKQVCGEYMYTNKIYPEVIPIALEDPPGNGAGSMLNLKNVTFSYSSGSKIFDDISINIDTDAITAVAGRNGTGKTTLTRLIMGIIHPQSGVIEFDGKLISDKPSYVLAKNIGYVFQNPDHQLFAATVYDEAAAHRCGLEWKQSRYENVLMVLLRPPDCQKKRTSCRKPCHWVISDVYQ